MWLRGSLARHMIEIERRFLFNGKEDWLKAHSTEIWDCVQGYLMHGPDRILRVGRYSPLLDRRRPNPRPHAMICFKVSDSPLIRQEYEYPCPIEDAEEMLRRAEGFVIRKTRYWIKYMTQDERDPLWEIDIFHDENKGLRIAEIELTTHDEDIEGLYGMPDFLGKEVTEDKRYSNSYLSKIPFTQWEGTT